MPVKAGQGWASVLTQCALAQEWAVSPTRVGCVVPAPHLAPHLQLIHSAAATGVSHSRLWEMHVGSSLHLPRMSAWGPGAGGQPSIILGTELGLSTVRQLSPREYCSTTRQEAPQQPKHHSRHKTERNSGKRGEGKNLKRKIIFFKIQRI